MGLSLTMGIMGVINVAHGTVIILGSYVALTLFSGLGLHPVLSLLFVLPFFFAAGAIVDRVLVRRVVLESEVSSLLILFGVAVMIENSTILTWTTDTQVITLGYTGTSVFLGDAAIPITRLIAGAITLVLVIVTNYFLQHTISGKAIHAMSQNRDAALMLGINVDRLSMVAFGIGIATAAAAGVIVATIYPFVPADQITWLTKAFLIVIIGGPGNLRNTVIAAFFIGLIETITPLVIPFKFINLVLYGLLALGLIFRGRGLAAVRSRTL
jgi:branched-chain amino acid transport system permease protein